MSYQSRITDFFKAKNTNACDKRENEVNTSSAVKRTRVSSRNEVVKRLGSCDARATREAREARVRLCPFYKRVANTRFVVDAFSYGAIDGVSAYFLTHFHSDHYNGLRKQFNQTIYCSPITARLVCHHFGIDAKFVIAIPLNQTRRIDGVEVTLLEANHCPGSVMIVFDTTDGKRHLHCGDFRAHESMYSLTPLTTHRFDTIYLDTTYCDPKYNFAPQNQCIDLIVSISAEAVNNNSKLLIICGTYSIGKENVFLAIANALKLNVWADYYKRQIYKCYNDSTLNSLLVSNKSESKLHVLPMNSVNFKFLEQYLLGMNGCFNEILAFLPTGWQFNNTSLNNIKPRRNKNITIYGIPYSEHSSFSELKAFIQHLRPLKVIPTVNNGNQQAIKKMNDLFKEWLS